MLLLRSVFLLGIGAIGFAQAQEPQPSSSWLYTSSDLLNSPDGVKLSTPGRFTLKVWSTSKPELARSPGKDQQPEAVVIKLQPENLDATPQWQTVGEVELKKDQTVRIGVESLVEKVAAAPVLLSVSSDAEFTPKQSLDVLRSQVKSPRPTRDLRRTENRPNQEGADCAPPVSKVAWEERARQVREHLMVTLGLCPMPAKTALNPVVEDTLVRDGYVIDKVVLETLPGFYMAGNLFRPVGKEGRLAVVLSPHGHYPEGRVHPDVQARCIRLAQLGCVVFMYDMVGYADGKKFGHVFGNERIRRWGLSLPGLQTWNSIRALDWLLTRSDVDPARVAVTGESGGGTQTFLLTAIDPRIKVAAPVVMVSDSFQGGCVCENAPGLRIGTDNVEFAALAAPRPMKLVGATGDWTARTLTNALGSLQMVYAQTGAATHLSAEVIDCPHNYNQTSRNAIYPFMSHWLLGVDDPQAVKEGTLKIEDPKDLFVFNDAHHYPSDAREPAQVEDDLIRSLSDSLNRLAPGDDTTSWEASRPLLAKILRVRLAMESVAPRETSAKEVRRVSRDNLTIVHYSVGRQRRGDVVPVVKLVPAKANGRSTVLMTTRGKADLIASDGKVTAVVQALLDRGQVVVGFDQMGVGEAFDPTSRFGQTSYFDCYNKTLPAEQAQDLATVVSWTRALADIREVSLLGTSPVALLALPELDGLARTFIDLGGFDDQAPSARIPASLDLPGLFQFGGLKSAAALCSPKPLRVVGVPESFNVGWAERAYRLDDAAANLRVDRTSVEPVEMARWLAPLE